MTKDDSKIEVEQIQDTTKQLPHPTELFGAPQPSLTSFTAGAVGGSYGGTEQNILSNTRVRVLELEDRLIRAGIIKGTFGG